MGLGDLWRGNSVYGVWWIDRTVRGTVAFALQKYAIKWTQDRKNSVLIERVAEATDAFTNLMLGVDDGYRGFDGYDS